MWISLRLAAEGVEEDTPAVEFGPGVPEDGEVGVSSGPVFPGVAVEAAPN